jgi:flagellar protein FlaG
MINDISQQLQMPVRNSQRTAVRADAPAETSAADLQKAQKTLSDALDKAAESQQEVRENLKETVSQLNDIVQTIERDLKFSIDESSGDTVITVLDTKSQEVVRQIPPEYVLAVRENLESLKGILFSAEI